jgi:CheY-like chemotaxis protein
MIVDDSALILHAVGETLRGAGYEVIARSVAIGTGAAILRERPALVLMDVSMPLLTGTEISESLNASSTSHSSIIVLFSDRPSADLEVLTQGCSAAGFIPKSAPASTLLSEVSRYLAHRSSRPSPDRKRGRLDEVLVAGRADTYDWARELLRPHAVVRGTDSGTEALRIMNASDAPGAVLLGTGLLDLPAHTTWSHATRNDERWRDRIIVVEESGHPGRPALPGMRKWSRADPDSVLLAWLGFGARG